MMVVLNPAIDIFLMSFLWEIFGIILNWLMHLIQTDLKDYYHVLLKEDINVRNVRYIHIVQVGATMWL